MGQNNYIFRGRLFTTEDIYIIKNVITEHWSKGRTAIAKIICSKLNWVSGNGRLKHIACLEALRKMEQKTLLDLPTSISRGGYRKIRLLKAKEVNFKKPKEKITGLLEIPVKLSFEIVREPHKDRLWRYLIQRFHYLGYKRMVGRHIKYFIYLQDKLVALISFSDGIYHHHLRDNWLGWDNTTRNKKRHLIINNNRFLILPWVTIRNLGSFILSKVAKIVADDWEVKYGYRPEFLETFVETNRFTGAVYKAANWKCLGKTCGEGRKGLKYFYHGKIRDYYIYPLVKN